MSLVHARSIRFFGTRDILFSWGYLDWKPHRDVARRVRVGSEAKRNKTTFLPFLFSTPLVASRWLSDAECWHAITVLSHGRSSSRTLVIRWYSRVWDGREHRSSIFIRTDVSSLVPVAFYMSRRVASRTFCAYFSVASIFIQVRSENVLKESSLSWVTIAKFPSKHFWRYYLSFNSII